MRKLSLRCLAAALAGLLLAVVLVVLFPPKAHAQGAGGATITFLGEPCRLRERVSNLPVRVTWSESGRVVEGCWARDAKRNLVVAYFEDGEVRVWTFDEVKQHTRPARMT